MAWAPRRGRRSRTWRFYRVVRLLFGTVWVLARERTRVLRARGRGDYGVEPDAEALRRVMAEFRETAVALGGLMIKLGQFLSTRADLLPPDALAEVARLQDEVPPEPYAEIASALECELGSPLDAVFAAIERKPAGSASLGQVHRARLRSGVEVAVKVQRPGIREIVHADLAALDLVLRVMRLLLPALERALDTRRLFREFSRVVFEELDYRREGRSAERFARLFAHADDVAAPAVIWEHSTRRVLTLEWMDGIKVSDVAALDAARVDRRALARRLTELYLAQVLRHGYFHADPHPGNIFVRPRPGGFQIAFVDFGMMGAILPSDRRALTSAFMAIVRQDAAELVEVLGTLGFLGATASRDGLQHVLAQLLDRYSTLTMGELRELDPAELLEDVETLLYGNHFRLPAHFAFLGRAAATLSGVVTQLAPEFNFLEVALPYAREYLSRGALGALLGAAGVDTASELGQLILREGVALARSATALPRLAERVLQRVEQGELRLVLDDPDFSTRTHARVVGRAARRTMSQPVPLWVPLGLGGTALAALALWRRAANGG